jgi:hypothetical protein
LDNAIGAAVAISITIDSLLCAYHIGLSSLLSFLKIKDKTIQSNELTIL